jgi:O-acetyl-ADP-ribose deacetylase (regulator of RNase III)
MIQIKRGNLLEAEIEALVNTVNTVGVMGKGIALQFKKAYPENYKAYARACKLGEVTLGKMFVYERGQLVGPKYIINFPTKKHWRGKARLEDIGQGLVDLVNVIKERRIKSVAIPPLGCGNGGLEWVDVRELIEMSLNAVPDVQVLLYPPQEKPKATRMRVATAPPGWTAARAALVTAFSRYLVPGYTLSLLEAQKLAYFLQSADEPLNLEFVKSKYGPYAERLNHLLQRIEGHFIYGYGDRTTRAAITVNPSASKEAEGILTYNHTTQDHLARVTKLIEGFETPYGLELLSTVHWLANEDAHVRSDADAAIAGVHSWSQRKRGKFPREHIERAWERLRSLSWI